MFVLASQSSRRLELLKQIGYIPDLVCNPSINENYPLRERKNGNLETPRKTAVRLAHEKVTAISQKYPHALVLAADTLVAVGRRILPKCEEESQVRDCLQLLSGRASRIFTGICVIHQQSAYQKLAETRIKVKNLSHVDIEHYIASGEWHNKAGGLSIQGMAGAFIRHLSGSYSSAIGLPLYETSIILQRFGLKPIDGTKERKS